MTSTVSHARGRTALDPWRLCLALALLGAAAVMVAASHALRVQEARLAAPLLELVTGHRARSLPGRPEVMAGLGTSWSSILEVSVMCSAAVLFVPVLVIAAVLAPARQIQPGRLLAALAVCAVGILATNTVRIIVIAVSMERWGAGRGYVLAHDTLGTLISLIGVGLALLLFVRLTVGRVSRPADLTQARPSRTGRHRPEPSGTGADPTNEPERS